MKLTITRRTALPALAMAALLLGGCATQHEPLYYWGSYPGMVHGHLTGSKSPEQQIQALEADAEKAKAKGKALPPGFRAHLGMLYGETGRTDQFRSNLEAEKAYFPEGSSFMDFLIAKFNKQ